MSGSPMVCSVMSAAPSSVHAPRYVCIVRCPSGVMRMWLRAVGAPDPLRYGILIVAYGVRNDPLGS